MTISYANGLYSLSQWEMAGVRTALAFPLMPQEADGWDRPNGPFLAAQQG
jgi:hypothetical protein